MPREFIIERYSAGLWPMLKGSLPFVVRGTEFYRFVIPGSMARHAEYRFIPALISSLEGLGDGDWRHEIAEFLLREGIVAALWSVDRPTCAPVAERWDRSILGVAAEIPRGDPTKWTLELLAGLGGAEHYINMVATDGLTLEAVTIPA